MIILSADFPKLFKKGMLNVGVFAHFVIYIFLILY